MQERNVISRGGSGAVGTTSLIAVLVIAALIGLFIWQPWNGAGTQNFTTITTQQGSTTSSQR